MVTVVPRARIAVSQRMVCDDLVRMVPSLATSREALLSLTEQIPIPHYLAARQLFEALLRVCKSVPWLEQAAQAEWLSRDALTSWIAAIAADVEVKNAAFMEARSNGRSIPRPDRHYQSDSHLKHLRQEYAVLSCLLDAQAVPPSGVEQLRAALLLSISQWGVGTHVGARDALASSIRGARRRPSSELGKFLPSLGGAETIEAFLAVAASLPAGVSLELRKAWPTICAVLSGLNGLSRTAPKAPPKIAVMAPLVGG